MTGTGVGEAMTSKPETRHEDGLDRNLVTPIRRASEAIFPIPRLRFLVSMITLPTFRWVTIKASDDSSVTQS